MLTSFLATMSICVKHVQLNLTVFMQHVKPLTKAGCLYTSHDGVSGCSTGLGWQQIDSLTW